MRLLQFEDGITHHIALTRGEWAGFEWLVEDHGFREAVLLSEVFDHARCWPDAYPVDFEYALRQSLRELISAFVSIERNALHDLANDNSQVWIAPALNV